MLDEDFKDKMIDAVARIETKVASVPDLIKDVSTVKERSKSNRLLIYTLFGIITSMLAGTVATSWKTVAGMITN